MVTLPESHLPYADKYFIRSRRILQREGLDPWVTMQVFFRNGPGSMAGVAEVAEVFQAYSDLAGHGGQVWALPEGSVFAPLEPVMHIEGPIQDFIELETMYLGILTSRTSQANGIAPPEPAAVTAKARAIRELLPTKNLMYFGARHWHWSLEPALCRAAVAGGFDACATDAGAKAAGLPGGMGTIPHALVLIYAHAVGPRHATREATLAFARHIEPECGRIALVDTFNHEIDDALDTARALDGALWGVRLDTAGELVGQGGVDGNGRDFASGKGVTIASVAAVRAALDAAGFKQVNIVLSSGFGNLDKVAAFAAAERRHGRLFESLGIGGLFPAWCATADIVRVAGRPLAKAGRAYRENPRLRQIV
ncbi:MAG: nicotinate phosphoribosyltransferase [Acidobacteriota bacterium]